MKNPLHEIDKLLAEVDASVRLVKDLAAAPGMGFPMFDSEEDFTNRLIFPSMCIPWVEIGEDSDEDVPFASAQCDCEEIEDGIYECDGLMTQMNLPIRVEGRMEYSFAPDSSATWLMRARYEDAPYAPVSTWANSILFPDLYGEWVYENPYS